MGYNLLAQIEVVEATAFRLHMLLTCSKQLAKLSVVSSKEARLKYLVLGLEG